jgi:hypothetical protein
MAKCAVVVLKNHVSNQQGPRLARHGLLLKNMKARAHTTRPPRPLISVRRQPHHDYGIGLETEMKLYCANTKSF